MQHAKKLGGALTAMVLLGVQSAHAALPTAAAAAFTDLSGVIDDVETAAWPLIAASLVVFGIIRLVKRGARQI